MPDGGVGRAGVGTGSGTNGSSAAGAVAGTMNWLSGGATGCAGTAGAAIAGGVGTASGGSVEGGAEPAGAGAGCRFGSVMLLGAGTSLSRVVPHGLRTLPACTVTVSDADRPPALIVATVVPAL